MSNWEEKLRERMEEHQEMPPADLWMDIELSLNKRSSVSPILPRRNWKKRLLSTAALLLLFLSAGYLLWYNKPIAGSDSEMVTTYSVTNSVEGNKDVNIQNIYGENKSKEANITTDNKPVNIARDSKTVDEGCATEQEIQYPLLTVAPSIGSTNEQDKEVGNNLTETGKQVMSSKGAINSTKTHEKNKLEEVNRKPALLPAKNNSSSFVGIGLYASNISSNYSNQENKGTPSVSNKHDNHVFDENDDLLLGAILENNFYRDVVTKVKHKQPIRFGASINIALNNKWSLTSGLTYTKLTSDLFSGSDVYYYTGQQTLHYIGIPISVKFNILEYNGFSFYSSVGGMLEKNVSGKLKTHYILDNKQESVKSENIKIDQLQVSVQLALGLQYRFTPLIGIFVEPSLGYYFKKNNKIETIYQKKSLNLNLSLGLNFNL